MPIAFRILGRPGRDNALRVRIESGQAIARLLLDCGEGCLNGLSVSGIQATDHLLFSHLHMDHVGGFDSFFRLNYNRQTKPVVVWGPPGTAEIMHHRFRGFWWNLYAGQSGTWLVNDVHPDRVDRSRFEAAEAFAVRHPDGMEPRDDPAGMILDEDEFSVHAIQLEHRGPCLGYLVREAPHRNVDRDRMEKRGLEPGPWLKELKSGSVRATVEVDGRVLDLAELRADLLSSSPGGTIAYLTDFLLDEKAFERLSTWLRGCDTVVGEGMYRHDDLALARRHHHATARQVAELAASAGVGRLILFHLSERYTDEECAEILRECKDVFPATGFGFEGSEPT